MGFLTDRFRFVIVFSSFWCLTIINSNYININFTFICMKHDDSDGIADANGTLHSRYDYSPQEKSLVLGAVAAGTIIGTFPINVAYVKLGARLPFLIAGVLSTISTIAIPLAARVSFPTLLLLRFVQGLAYSADFAAIGILCVRWAPLSETGTYIAVLTSFTGVSSMVTNVVAGWFCSTSLGWRFSFYAHAIASVVFFVFWYFLYRDDPSSHPKISEKELKHINKGKSAAHIAGDKFVPYKDVIFNKVILVVWFNAYADLTAAIFIVSYTPIYLHTVLGFDIQTTAALSVGMTFPMVPLRFVTGYMSDKMNMLNENWKMIFFNTLSVGFAGVAVCMIGVVGDHMEGKTAFILFTAFNLLMCVNSGGFYKCGTLVSRQYAHFVLATIQFMKCVALVTAPAIVAFFVKNETDVTEWAPVFYFNGGLMILAHFFFVIVCTDQPAEFTKTNGETTNFEEMENLKEKAEA